MTEVLTRRGHRNRGHASALLGSVFVEAWSMGLDAVYLHVEGGNAGAIRAYEKAGMGRVTGEEAEGFGRGLGLKDGHLLMAVGRPGGGSNNGGT